MKQVFKYMMAAALVATTFGLVACNKDDNGNKEEPTPTVTPDPQRPAGDIALHQGSVDGPYIYDGDTIRYTTTDMDMNILHRADVHTYIENQTSAAIEVNHSYELQYGPAGVVTEVCANGSCPWNNQVYSIQSGPCSNPYTIETYLQSEYSGQQILYKVMVGKGQRMSNPVTFYLLINVQ